MNETEKPNIFFLLIDSFRADKFYGKEKTSVTPNLDSLTKQGIFFKQTINTAPSSVSAVSSVLTGKWAFKAVVKGEKRRKLNPNCPNYVKSLNKLGYNTIALTPQIFIDSKMTADFKTSLIFENGLHNGVGKQIIDILEKLESPWFFFIHLLEIHGSAQEYPQKFNDKKYGINQYERRISAMDPWFGEFFKRIDLKNTLITITADHSTDRGIYTTEMEDLKLNLNQNNLQPFVNVGRKLPFGKLSKKILKKIYLTKKDKTKKQKQHNALKNKENLRPYDKRVLDNLISPTFDVFDNRYNIPVLFAGMGLESKIIDRQIRSIDTFPTIFDILKIPNKIISDGKSVLPLINNDSSFEELPAFMETISNWVEPKSSTQLDIIGIRYNNFKYFRLRDDINKEVNLYDLTKDPLEEENLASKEPEKLIEMEKILTKLYSNSNKDFEK